MIRRAIYPGSFDPVTCGHLDIIERASRMFDEVMVAVLVNPNKVSLFSIEERVEILREVMTLKADKFSARIVVDTFGGLLADYAQQQEAQAVIRGIRGDFRLRLRTTIGVDESPSCADGRNRLFIICAGIFLPQFAPRQRSFHVRRQY